MSTFCTLDWVVIGAYMALMLAIGGWFGSRIKGSRKYFIGDGKMNHIVVGISIVGTYLSSLTMIALPGAAYGVHDWTYTVQLPFLALTAFVICRYVLPSYREAGVISIYGFLEKRIHVSARLVGSVSFILMAIGRMSVILCLTALAFHTATGFSLVTTIIVMGVITMVYTVIGGIEAVIWTDVIQVVVFVAAAVLSLFFIVRDVPPEQFLQIANDHHKFRVLIPEFDPRKIVTLWLVLETIYQTIRIYGTQQDIAQRYMTTESTRKANISVWIGTLAYIPMGFLFYFIGTALFVYYQVHSDIPLPAKPDQIYPFFVVHALPAGITGLVLAAFLAAAMSSIDACMNSAATVCVEDFLKRFGRQDRSDARSLRLAQWLTVGFGLLAILLALGFTKAEYAQILWGKVMGIATNGMLGLLLLALMPMRINKWAAGAGIVAAYMALFLAMGTGVNFLLWPVIGNTVCFFVGLFLSPLFNAAEAMEAMRPSSGGGARP